MPRFSTKFLIFVVICVVLTIAGGSILKGIEKQQLEIWLAEMGHYAPLLYIFTYIVGTLLIFPSTPLNLMGGAFFGVWWGTLWTTIAAILAAIISFAFTRSLGREFVAKKLAGKWKTIDRQICKGGLGYIIAIRLLPIIPYGLVNFSAGLTSINFKNYLIGTTVGTLPGIMPFVMMGAGINQLSQGNITTLLLALTLTGMLIGTATILKNKSRL